MWPFKRKPVVEQAEEPTPEPVSEKAPEPAHCRECGVRDCKVCARKYAISEPVHSILAAVKKRRKTFLFSTRTEHRERCNVEYFGLADTQTGRVVTVAYQTSFRLHGGVSWKWFGHEELGITLHEMQWLVTHIRQHLSKLNRRAAALAAAKRRAELMQEYVL